MQQVGPGVLPLSLPRRARRRPGQPAARSLVGRSHHDRRHALGPALDELLLAKAQELQAAGRRPFVWDRVTGRPIAAVSYALALAELLEQRFSPGIPTSI